MVDGDDSFKRPGAVPFNWEIRPGVPKTRNPQLDDQPPKKLAPLRLKPLPPPLSSSSSESKSRPVSPFAPPSSFKLKPPPDSDPQSSRPPTPYFRSSSRRAESGVSLRRYLPKLFGLKKSKKPGQDSTSSESDNFYESDTTEGSSKGSVSTRWSSPKSSLPSLRGSPLKRSESDLSSYEKKTIVMMARDHRLG